MCIRDRDESGESVGDYEEPLDDDMIDDTIPLDEMDVSDDSLDLLEGMGIDDDSLDLDDLDLDMVDAMDDDL